MLSVIQIVQCQICHTDDRVHGRADVVAHSGEKICFGAVGFLSQIQGILQYRSGIFFGPDDISNITSDKTNRMMTFVAPKDVDLFVLFAAVISKIWQRKFVTLRFLCQPAEDDRQRKFFCRSFIRCQFSIRKAELVQCSVKVRAFIG